MMVAVWTLGLIALGSLFARRMPPPAAIGYATIAFFGGELAVLLVGPLLGVPLPWAEVVLWGAVTVVAVVGAVRGPRLTLDRRAVAVGIAASSGAVILIVGLALTAVLPGSLGLGWAMNGDAVNVVVFVRELLGAGGIDASASDSPTPLPFAMIASAMAVGRAGVADAALATHDVTALAVVWTFVLALSSILAGAVAAHGARGARTRLAVPVTAVASLVTLTWWVLGVQVQFGFVTVAFSVAILLAGWLVFLDASERPVLALSALIVATAAILGTWSPLAVCLVPLGVVVVVRSWRAILRAGLAGWLLIGGAVLLVMVYLALAGIPLFLRAAGFLGADGGFPPIGAGVILALTALAGLATAVMVRLRPNDSAALTGIIALAGGFAVGLGFLLLQRAHSEPLWGYYPAKFAWTVSIVLVVIAIGSAAALLDRLGSGWSARAASAFGVLLLVGLLWSPTEPLGPTGQLPLVGILRGDAFGQFPGQASEVLALTGREAQPTIYWHTSFDRWANLWLLQLDIEDFNTNPVRPLAFEYALDPDQVCQAAELLGGDVVVVTEDPAAQGVLDDACPDVSLTVRMR